MCALLAAACASGDRGAETAPQGGGTLQALVAVTIERPGRDAFAYTIACNGGDATLEGSAAIDPAAACAALSDPAAQRRLFDGAAPDRMCTQQYGGPETARLAGTIDGERFAATIDRRDGCGISEWDDLLGPVLPRT